MTAHVVIEEEKVEISYLHRISVTGGRAEQLVIPLDARCTPDQVTSQLDS